MEHISAVSQQQVLDELAAIGFAKATDYLEVRDGKLDIYATDGLEPGQAAAIAQIERTSSGLRLKLYDKLKALELLGKSMGLFDAKAPPTGENNLLDALMTITDKEVDTHDLPELQQTPESGHDLVEPSEAEGL